MLKLILILFLMSSIECVTSNSTLNWAEICSFQRKRTSLHQDSIRIELGVGSLDLYWPSREDSTPLNTSYMKLEKFTIFFNIIIFYWVVKCFNWNWCASVLYTLDKLGGVACVNIRIPWWWHPRSVETCKKETVC